MLSVAIVRLNKAETFSAIEKFDGTFNFVGHIVLILDYFLVLRLL